MNRLRLLVVNESADQRARYRTLFERAGCEFIVAETAAECLRIVAENPPDLVLLDLGSRDMSAIDLCREIKGDKHTGVLVLYLSGEKAASQGQLEDLENCADHYLTKPVDDRTLLAHVNALLRIKSSEDAVRRTERAIQEAQEQLENKVLQRTAELMAANTFLKQEIAERKRIEAALVAVTTEWEQTFNAVPDQVCITDLQGKIVRANRAMRNRFEPEHGNLVGLDYRICYCGTAYPEPPPSWTEVLSGGPPSLTETTLPALEGSFVVASYPLFDAKGEQWGALSAVRDITDQRRTQEALEAAEEKYRQIFENAIEGIFQSTPSGRFISANPALARMFGYDSPDELIRDRRNIELQHYVDPEQRKVFKNLVEENGYVRGFELQAYRKDGTIIWTSENVRAVRDEAGAVRYYEGIVEDITRRKEIEAEQLELLRRLVRAQEDEQRRISRELHDQMGQSLAALLLGLKSVKDTAQDDLLITEIQRLQEITNRMANDMHSLISELRPPALDDLGLHTAVSDYIDEWSERTNIAVDFHINGLLDQRLESQLESTIYRIVQEALNNVMKHARAQSVSVIFEKRGNRISVIVEDDGIGFDVEALMKTPAKNRRFGLFGMQERVMLVGGSLNIESTPGVGTTILVHIDTSRNLGRQNE